jgi:pyruvate dehydrogenase E1 component beta subunit
VVPIGKAKIMKEGTDVTIVGYSRNVKFSLEAAELLAKEGISCEVINLRTIKPLDRDTIVESVKKTGRLVTVEDGFPQSGIGAEIIAVIDETEGFDYLRGPVQRVTAVDIPMPYSKLLEDTVVPRADTIAKAVRKVMKSL